MGLFSFFPTVGKKSTANIGDGGVQLVVRDSIPSKTEVRCCEEWAMSSMSIGMGWECLFSVTPMDLVV